MKTPEEINIKHSRFSAPYFTITLPLLPVKCSLMYDLKGRWFKTTVQNRVYIISISQEKNLKQQASLRHFTLFSPSAVKQRSSDLILRSETVCEELWEFLCQSL